MSINSVALGTDIVSIQRVQKALARSGEVFLRRIFDGSELLMRGDVGFLATRFAAKEAFFKALGRGVSGGIKWHDFLLPPEDNYCLNPLISGKARDLLRGRNVQVSVSRTETTAVAVVFLEEKRGSL
jgi:holo-[acyl-carrier protein] synthase